MKNEPKFNSTDPDTPEGERESHFIDNVEFTAIRNKGGEIVKYKSSIPGRKAIELDPASILPEEDRPYSVEIVEDTDPDDPNAGKLIVRLTADYETEKHWKKIEEDVNQAERSERQLHRANVELFEETGMPKVVREKEPASGAADNREDVLNSEVLGDLEREAEAIKQEVEAILGPEDSPQRALIELRYDNLEDALKKNKKIEQERGEFLEREARLLKGIAEAEREGKPASGKMKKLDETREKLKNLEAQSEKLLRSSPEAWITLHLKELKQYKQDLKEGRIVKTEYVRKQIEDIVSHMRQNAPVLIHGHLGAGKTEIAMTAAKEAAIRAQAENDFEEWLKQNKDATEKEREDRFMELLRFHEEKSKNKQSSGLYSAVVISGSKHATPADFYGHQTLALDKVAEDELGGYEKEVYAKYQEWIDENKELLNNLSEHEREAEKHRAHDRIFQIYLTQFQNGTVSKYLLGPIYKAMEEGRPVIIDEVNAIKHEALISLNHILTRRVGEEIADPREPGKTIKVKNGFGIIMTGNLNRGEEIYKDREVMDPAFLDRLYRLEQHYLPQQIDGDLAESAGQKNELFYVMLARLMDNNGNIEAPKGSLEKLWELAKMARLTQNIFAGMEVSEDKQYHASGGRPMSYALQESVLSLRGVDKILTRWIRDGYKYELDYYVWKEFGASSTAPADRAYLYQLLHNRYGFFQGDGWEQNPKYGTIDNVKSFNIQLPENSAEEREFLGPRDVVEIVYGGAPKRTRWPATLDEEMIDDNIAEIEQKATDLKNDAEALQEEIKEYCETKS